MKTTDRRPIILVSNDDGIDAKGVRALIEALPDHCEIICVCPDGPRSAQGMALTLSTPMRVKRIEDFAGARMYKVNGTPVDCVKIGVDVIIKGLPDLVVAGINHGSNAAVNVIYSGTMGAVMEGCAFGVTSVGFSLTTHDPDADFTGCGPFVKEIVNKLIEKPLPEDVCLNVNIPAGKPFPTEMRIARGCRGKWIDNYAEFTDPQGETFYWLTGKFINGEPDATDTDEWCLNHRIVSVVPTLLDRTAPDLKHYDYLVTKD